MNSRLGLWLLAVIILCAGAVLYSRHRALRPCGHLIMYSVGVIDPRFEVTKDGVVRDAGLAAAIWNRAARRPLFEYDAVAGPLKINLVYDARQQNATLGIALNEQDAAQDTARRTLYAARDRLTDQKDSYNLDVQTLNARGGATADESRALETRRMALDALSDSLRRAAASYNERNNAIKSKVDQFNQQAGQIFTAGRYVHNDTGERIDVFRAIGDTELTRLLAHEFGHALGLDHNADSASIMYDLSETGNLTPSPADLRSLRTVCGM
jgi:cell division protein FtsL